MNELSDLTFQQLANVQTVGIGLYLALALIQAISATGIIGLRRRATTLRAAVVDTKQQSQFANTRRLLGEIGKLEIGFHSLNRTIMWAVSALFTISVAYFAYCTVHQDLNAGLCGALFILLFYLAMPMIIFAASALVIAKKCKEVAQKISDAEKRFLQVSLEANAE
jgi:hypothetical protein